MTQRSARILEECRAWPEEERAELADMLIESLESEVDRLVVWDEEIAERITELDNGTVSCVPSEEVHRSIRNMIDASRLSPPRTA